MCMTHTLYRGVVLAVVPTTRQSASSKNRDNKHNSKQILSSSSFYDRGKIREDVCLGALNSELSDSPCELLQNQESLSALSVSTQIVIP